MAQSHGKAAKAKGSKHQGGSKRAKQRHAADDHRTTREDSMPSLPSIDFGLDLEFDTELTDHDGTFSPIVAERKGQWRVALASRFLPIYYRNERFNMQCFPDCREFGDYAIGKRLGKAHSHATGCVFPVSGLIRTPHAGIAYNDILALGHIVLVDDNPHSYFAVGEKYPYDLVQALMAPPPPADTSKSNGRRAKAAGGGDGGPPALVRGTNAEMEKASGVQLLNDQPLEVLFNPPQDRWFFNVQLPKKKPSRRRKVEEVIVRNQFVFEMLVFHLPVSENVDHELEYSLVSIQRSPPFEIASTRTLVRQIAAETAAREVAEAPVMRVNKMKKGAKAKRKAKSVKVGGKHVNVKVEEDEYEAPAMPTSTYDSGVNVRDSSLDALYLSASAPPPPSSRNELNFGAVPSRRARKSAAPPTSLGGGGGAFSDGLLSSSKVMKRAETAEDSDDDGSEAEEECEACEEIEEASDVDDECDRSESDNEAETDWGSDDEAETDEGERDYTEDKETLAELTDALSSVDISDTSGEAEVATAGTTMTTTRSAQKSSDDKAGGGFIRAVTAFTALFAGLRPFSSKASNASTDEEEEEREQHKE